MAGAAKNDRMKCQSGPEPDLFMSQHAPIEPSTAYVAEPFTLKRLMVTSTMNDDRRITTIDLQSIEKSPIWSYTDSSTEPRLLSHKAESRHTKTTQLKSLPLIAHVGAYTPERVLYSLVKNQRDTATRNNMRQSIPIHYKVLLIAITASWSATFSAPFARFSI